MGVRRKRVAVLSLGTETDVWNAARITAAWSRRRDVDRVEVVGWDLTRDACALLPGADAVHELPLAGLRARAAQHPLAAAIALRGAVEGITSQGSFDAVLNLTYGGFAGHLAPLLALDTHAVVGPFVDETGQWRASHPAFEYLATWGLDPSLNVFAHQDVWSAGAHVRTDEGGLLPPDSVADTLVEHGCGEGPTPLVLAPTEAAAGWLGFSWDALVPVLAHVTGRPVMLVAPTGQSTFVEGLAARTGAEIARWPMRHLAALLRRSGAVVTSDFATAVLASRVGVRQLWLRPQAPLPIASLPGPHMLSVAPGTQAVGLDAVLTLASWFLLQRETPTPTLRSVNAGISVHEIEHDNAGCLNAKPVHAPASARDKTLRAWRQIWRAAWINLPPLAADVRYVLGHDDGVRLARAKLDRGPVGRAIREGARTRQVAA